MNRITWLIVTEFDKISNYPSQWSDGEFHAALVAAIYRANARFIYQKTIIHTLQPIDIRRARVFWMASRTDLIHHALQLDGWSTLNNACLVVGHVHIFMNWIELWPNLVFSSRYALIRSVIMFSFFVRSLLYSAYSLTCCGEIIKWASFVLYASGWRK